jgi:hypothetical protein
MDWSTQAMPEAEGGRKKKQGEMVESK